MVDRADRTAKIGTIACLDELQGFEACAADPQFGPPLSAIEKVACAQKRQSLEKWQRQKSQSARGGRK